MATHDKEYRLYRISPTVTKSNNKHKNKQQKQTLGKGESYFQSCYTTLFELSSFQQQQQCEMFKETGKYDLYTHMHIKQGTEIVLAEAQRLYLLDRL